MKTTIDIPKELLEEAMQLTGATSENNLIKKALELQVSHIKRQRLLSFKGKVEIDLDLDTLRDRK